MLPPGLSAAADTPTGIAPAAWAAGAAGLAAGESAADGAPSATFRALAWSQDDDSRRRAGAVHRCGLQRRRLLRAHRRPATGRVHPGRRAGLRGRAGTAALVQTAHRSCSGRRQSAALLAIGGLAVTLTSNSGVLGPVTETSTTLSVGPSPGQPPTSVAPQTVTVTGSDGQPTHYRDHHRLRLRRRRPPRQRPLADHHHDDVAHNDHHHNHDNHNHDHDNDTDNDNDNDVATGTASPNPSPSRPLAGP